MSKDNSRRRTFRKKPYPLPSYCNEVEFSQPKEYSKINDKKDWEDVTCSVCIEHPHNAVLLLCSSYEKGCRPYMCGTSFRYSNCLDQYKKAYAKSVTSCNNLTVNKEAMELSCPLCRGQVKGWTVFEPARQHLNSKTRSCVQDNCSFVGTYRELKRHTKSIHPDAKPREVEPASEQKWTRFENERERQDAMSTIRSTMPGALFVGDYVIERNYQHSIDSLRERIEGMNRSIMSMNRVLEAIDHDLEHGNNGTSLSRRLLRQGISLMERSRRHWRGE